MDKDKLSKRQAACKARNSPGAWTPRKAAMLRCMVIEGLRPFEIAKKYKCEAGTIGKYRKEEEWIKREAAMKEDVYGLQKIQLGSLVDPAIDALRETVKSEDEGIKLRAATEILDRTGFPKGLQIDMEMKPVINLFMPEHLLGETVEGEVVDDGD